MGDKLTVVVKPITVQVLRQVAVDVGLVTTTGKQKGKGNLSALLDFIAERIESGHLHAFDLAKSRLILED